MARRAAIQKSRNGNVECHSPEGMERGRESGERQRVYEGEEGSESTAMAVKRTRAGDILSDFIYVARLARARARALSATVSNFPLKNR